MEEKQEHTERILAVVDRLRSPDLDVEQSLARWKQKHLQPKGVTRRLWIRVAAAAAIAVLAGAFFFLRTDSQMVETRLAESIVHALPDGSSVTLNADSRITYASRGFNKKRVLQIEGEAFFDVQKGSDFVVRTRLGNVKVLGTSFNVFVRGEKLDVACASGAVRVAENFTLKPGERIVLSSGKSLKTTIIESEIASWKSGISRFADTPLSEVIAEMERQYGLIIMPGTTDIKEKFTGGFAHGDLQSALRAVFPAMGISYEIKNDSTIVLQ